MHLPKVYIVIVNYNGWEDTIECLESVFKLDYANYNVILVDNKSTNNSFDYFKLWAEGKLNVYISNENKLQSLVYPVVSKPISYSAFLPNLLLNDISVTSKLSLIATEKNLGFAGGNNLGIQLALKNNADYVWLLNNDTVVPVNALTNLVNKFECQRTVNNLGVLGSKLMYYHNPNIIQAIIGEYKPVFANSLHVGAHAEDYGQYDNLKIKPLNYIVGASMFVSSQFIRDVGLMSEDYFLYFEELDWIKRGSEKGYEIAVCSDAKVYHKEGASTGGNVKFNNNNKSELSDYYSIKNKFLFTKKFFKGNLPTVYFSVIFIILNRLKRKQYNRIPLVLKIFYKSIKDDIQSSF